MLEFLYSFNTFLFGVVLLILLFRSDKNPIFIVIYLWHTLFCLFYFYNLDAGSDVYKYLYYAKNSLDDFSIYPGTPIIVNIIGFFLFFGFTDLSIFLVFNIIGTIALLLLYMVFQNIHSNNIFKYIIFLPSISYWSCAIGKDAIAFLAVALLVYGVSLNLNKKIIILAIFFMLLVRPHIALLILISIIVYFFVKSNISLYIKICATPFFVGLFLLLFNFVSNYVGLEDNSLNDVSSYMDYRQTLNQEGGSSIDMSSQPIYLKLFTYLFRPLPYEAHNFVALMASFENLFLLFLILSIIIKNYRQIKYLLKGEEFILLIYFLLGLLLLGNLVSNLGIASRQKWMIMPVLIYLVFILSSKYSKIKLNLLNRSSSKSE